MLKLALPLLALAFVSADKVSFEWKPIVGQTAEYKTTNTHKADLGAGEEDLVIAWPSKVTVDKVEGKRVWLKIENGEPTATIGGENADGIQVQVPDSTEEHGLDGKFYPPHDYEGLGFGLYSGFALPASALEVGGNYEIDGLKAKYVGLEKVGEWETHRFTFEYRQKSGPWCAGDIWLSSKDLTLVRRKAVMHEVDFGNGPTSIANEMLRTK